MVKTLSRSQPALFSDGELAEAPPPMLTDALEIWNEFAVKNKWKTAKVLDKARRAALNRAIPDYGGLLGFRAALQIVEKNRFVMGKIPPQPGRKQFVANLEWITRSETVRKVLEDFYEDDGGQRGGAPAGAGPGAATDPDSWPRRLGGYRKGGFWPTHWGKRPEDADCQAPAVLLERWRKDNGVAVVAVVRESHAERLAAMIRTYRKNDKWDRANMIEEQLAKLEGRPPVLVPAPDVAHLSTPPTNGARVQPAVDESKLGPSRRNERNYSNSMPPSISEPEWDMVPEGSEHDADD